MRAALGDMRRRYPDTGLRPRSGLIFLGGMYVTKFRRGESRDKNSRHKDPMSPSERIDQLIAELTDWRGKTFASIRKSILEADREIIEEWKWMGSPVWSHDGIIAVG